VLFTFVIPLALMTTYPALALLGRLDAATALAALGGALAFMAAARLVWKRAIGHYRSASS
jgi:ABC-2 type transport system permease protein